LNLLPFTLRPSRRVRDIHRSPPTLGFVDPSNPLRGLSGQADGLPLNPLPRMTATTRRPRYKIQFLTSIPALNLFLATSCFFASAAQFVPDQLHWPSLCRVVRPDAPVVPLHSLIEVRRDSDVERIVAAPQHVAEPFPCHSDLQYSESRLLNFFVRRVLPARVAKLLRFHPVGMLLPVLHGGVVPVFTIAALQCDDFSHVRLLDDLGYGAGAYRVPAFANREAQALLQCDRRNQRDFH